jgi:hypothetical protein
LKRQITLSWPDHPAYAEMVVALEDDVEYHIVGPRFRQPTTGGSRSVRSLPLAQRAAAQVRRFNLGAVAYQRLRSSIVLRSAEPGHLMHCCSHLIYGDSPWIGDYENVNVLGFYSPHLLHDGRFVEHLRRTFSQPSCRAIRVWSESAKRSFRTLFADADIRRKLCVIYPAMAFPPEARDIPARTGIA